MSSELMQLVISEEWTGTNWEMPRSQKGGLATARGAHDGHQIAGLEVSGDGRLRREASHTSEDPVRLIAELPRSASFVPHEGAHRRKPL